MPTPEYPHDPEFPYLVLFQQRDGLVLKIAKFKNPASAAAYAGNYGPAKVVDTTPKPRIPVDATMISWSDGAYLPQIAQKNPKPGPAGVGWFFADYDDGGRWYSEEELLRKIGDAEITVLDPRKEES